MVHCDIQIGVRDGGFRLHDIPVTIVTLNDLRFRLSFRAGADLIHLPENICQKPLFGFVHCRHFLRIVRVCGRLDRVDRKHFFPDCPAS